MTIMTKAVLPAVLAATFALAGFSARPALAQDGHHYTRTTRTTTTYHYMTRGPLSAGQREAQRLHREAVRLDHQATYEDQHGHPQLGASLARQASQLNARAYRAGQR